MQKNEWNDEKAIAYTVDKNGKIIFMHELIWESSAGPIPPGYMVPHKNVDGLDNRVENLCLIPDLNGDREYLIATCAREAGILN